MSKLKDLKEKYLTKKNKKIGIISICLLLIALVVIILIKNSTFAEEETDSLNLICPTTASKGELVECTISLNVLTINGQGFETHFETTPEIEYKEFENIINDYNLTANSDGLVMFSLEANKYFTGNIIVGKVKYQIPEDAEANSIYTVKLKGSILGGNDSEKNTKEIDFDDVVSKIRIESDINTLSNIELSDGTLNETFNSLTEEYTATVDKDNVTITATATDDNSFVEGDGEVVLNYGTNKIEIKVTSESNIERTYTISIFRPYSFSTDKYTYNKDKNYLYTKADSSEDIIISNLSLPNNLTGSINNNKLVIKNGEEILKKINIINISSNTYTMTGGKILIGEDTEYTELINNMILNGLTLKVLNGSDEITEGEITNNYKLAIYYENEKIDEYSFEKDYFNIDESLEVDNTNKIIKKVKAETTYNSLIEKITTNGTVSIVNKDNETVSKDSKVKTGDTIQIKISKNTYKYKVSVLGDVNGDGIINTGDVALLYRNLKGKTTLENYQIFAGDILNDGIIKINDVARLFRYYKGKITSLEVE